MKKFFVTLLALSAIGVSASCLAAENNVARKPAHRPPMMAGQQMPPMGMMRRPQMTEAQAMEKLQKDYGYTEQELSPYIKSGRDYRKMNSNCLLARLSDTDLDKVVELGKNMTSGRVRYKLGLSPKIYFERYTAWQAAKLAKELKLPEADILTLLHKNYTDNEIRMACALSVKTGKPAKTILAQKTAAISWEMLAGRLGMDYAAYEQVKQEVNPAPEGPRRSGAGFAGLHMRNPSKEYMLSILAKDYGFKTEELSPLFDKFGFQQLEQLCLYAHLAKKPLTQLVPLRAKYTWEGMKLAVGLDAEAYTRAAIRYQARRLQERQAIPEKLTIELMEKGYSLHHINTAYKYSLKCNKSIEQIIALKTPDKSWNKVAEECGIAKEYAEQIKKGISDSFGRHGK